MKLIRESVENIEILIESSASGKKSHYIKGVFLQSDITNRNGRFYPYEIMKREVDRYTKEYIKEDRALGELNHPDTIHINLDRVSHKIIELVPEGKNFIGKAKILDTPTGKIAQGLLDGGIKLGVSSRGVGSIEEKNGIKYVSHDFMLSTAADIVADPSAPHAFVEGIMEGVEWLYDSDKKVWISEQIKSKIESDSKSKSLSDERMLEHFEKFLKML
jgi:hypothetical protein